MNPPFSFQDTSMVFHAPVQRRHVGSDVRPPPAAPHLAARHPTAHLYPPEERSYSPLPTLPTLLRTRSHLRSMPDLGRSPISSPVPAPAPEAPIYRPFTLNATNSAGLGDTSRDHLDGFRARSRESSRLYSQYDDCDEKNYSDERFDAYSAPSRFLPHRNVRQDSARGRLVSDSYADSPSYTSSPLAYPEAEPQRANPARVRSVEPLSAPITEPVKKKRKARICTTEGCTKYVVDHGLCIRHGGGKRCYIDGCECRAQNRGLCWKHGGFTICKVDGCTKRAKSRGICWSHGGGTRCKRDECSKIAVSNGLCWAHGGGKRCTFGKCRKPASERTDNFCNEHYAQEYNSVQEADL